MHALAANTTDVARGEITHSHSASCGARCGGVSDINARTRTGTSGNGLTYVSKLQIVFDKRLDITADLLTQLEARDGACAWDQLGDGTSNHWLVTNGTGAIDLIELGLSLSTGPHSFKFTVPTGGGKIHYNLYIE